MARNLSKTEICLVMLIGLPGSGKTALCKALVEFFESRPSHTPSNYIIIPVCYDKLIPANVFRYEDDSNQWKKARKNVVNYVKQVVCYLKGLQDCNAIEFLDMSDREKLLVITQNGKNNKVYVIIDDNMYYRSMRYEYYQLAKQYNLSFCQLYLHCDVNDALSRNAIREKGMAVTEEIITRMARRLEPPDQHNIWETFSLICGCEIWTTSNIKYICDFLNNAMEYPIATPEDDSTIPQGSRVICSTNLMHQVDIMLRKLIGERMKESSLTGLKRDELQAQSKTLSNARQHILEKIKMGKIIIPKDICENIEMYQSSNVDQLRNCLSSLLTAN